MKEYLRFTLRCGKLGILFRVSFISLYALLIFQIIVYTDSVELDSLNDYIFIISLILGSIAIVWMRFILGYKNFKIITRENKVIYDDYVSVKKGTEKFGTLGWMYLTSDRIIFSAFHQDFNGKSFTINLTDIDTVTFPNSKKIVMKLKDNSTYSGQSFRIGALNNSDEWVHLIEKTMVGFKGGIPAVKSSKSKRH